MKSVIDEALETNHNRFDTDYEKPETEDDETFPLMAIAKKAVAVKDVEELNVEQDIKDDYTNARNYTQQLLEQQQELIKSMANFINTVPSPRAYEVMNNMMKTASEMSERLLGIQKQLKEIQEEEAGSGNRKDGDTFIFTGGPTNILAAIKKAAEAEKKVIDITPEADE